MKLLSASVLLLSITLLSSCGQPYDLAQSGDSALVAAGHGPVSGGGSLGGGGGVGGGGTGGGIGGGTGGTGGGGGGVGGGGSGGGNPGGGTGGNGGGGNGGGGPGPSTPPGAVSCGGNKVIICHFPPGNHLNPQTICVDSHAAMNGHRVPMNGSAGPLGDYLGACRP